MSKLKNISEKSADEIIAMLEVFIQDQEVVERIRAARNAIVGTIDRAVGHAIQEVNNDS
jgi:hemerythrin-like domain-containing protein